MSVRVSPISRTAAILIVIIGVVVLLAGLTVESVPNVVAGVAFIVLGVVLLGVLVRFTAKVKKELDEADEP